MSRPIIGHNLSVESTGDQPCGTVLANGLYPNGYESSWNVLAAKWIAANTPFDAAAFYVEEGLLRWDHKKHARDLANLLLVEHDKQPEGKQDAKGHSNACALLIEALSIILAEKYGGKRFMPEPGDTSATFLDDLHLFGAYISPDMRKHLNQLLAANMVGRVFLYVSASDETVGWSWFRKWTMGRDGPTKSRFITRWTTLNQLLNTDLTGARVIVVRDNSMRHSDWVCGVGGFNKLVLQTSIKVSTPPADAPAVV
jgi:hypothetical protein